MGAISFQRITGAAILILAAATLSLHIYAATTQTGFWVFQTSRFIPVWYLVGWGVLLVGLCVGVYRFHERVETWLETRTAGVTLFALLLALIGIFSYDSFVFGGGNLRVAQIAQVDTIVLERHEFGSLATVAGLFHFLKLFGLKNEMAGVWGWRIFAFACSALSIFGAVLLARLLTPISGRRLAIVAISLFAGPFLMLCGYIGIQPIIVTATIWFSVAAYRLAEQVSLLRLAAVWGICLAAIFMTASSAFLIPATVCVTVASLWRRNWNWLVGGITGLAVMGGLSAWLFCAADRSVWISQFLVMPGGKLPLKHYSLQSAANLMDKGLLVMAIAPLGMLLLVLVWRRLDSMTDRIFAATIIVATIAGRATQVALDPVNGIVLDFPLFTAYLAPLAIALAFFLDRRAAERLISRRTSFTVVALSIMAPLLIAPTFTKIDGVEPLARAYAERHDHYYRATGVGFRDAYFYKKNLKKANSWEWSLPIKSQDFLNMRGCADLVAHGQNADALVSLYRLVGRQPYWAEPRALLVRLQLKLAHPEIAKHHLDTCLMLDPHSIQHRTLLYQYYKAVGQWDSARVALESAGRQFPSDRAITTDDMIMSFESGQFSRADSIAGILLAADTASAYAHLIKGRLAERKGLVDSAASEYRRFIRTAPPGNPDIEIVGKLLSELKRDQN